MQSQAAGGQGRVVTVGGREVEAVPVVLDDDGEGPGVVNQPGAHRRRPRVRHHVVQRFLDDFERLVRDLRCQRACVPDHCQLGRGAGHRFGPGQFAGDRLVQGPAGERRRPHAQDGAARLGEGVVGNGSGLAQMWRHRVLAAVEPAGFFRLVEAEQQGGQGTADGFMDVPDGAFAFGCDGGLAFPDGRGGVQF